MRIGHGYDVHAFAPGDHVMLGGVRIPHEQGIRAHSDGDVLLHAICDALLGAAALGDIGRHFPDTNELWRGVDSRLLLKEVLKLLARRDLKPLQVDATVIAEAPKLAPHIGAMRANIAADLGVPADCVNVKA
ncbi:MAG TPA: 2-C-methyl-D-erythritol 2,4-cyclodiphosphate synthase, partial [Gammaproteobacteria bacterium]|nr:2-C-methyl-D-erythritol 2,4-cyclodiphosphate synthase [Gammaproteobacteria bacterium]